MADLNKFQRSRDRITEILNYVISITDGGDETIPSIYALEKSIKIIDNKIAECKRNERDY